MATTDNEVALAQARALHGGDSEQTRYVVQVQEDDDAWKDIASVDAPPRTRRRTIIQRAIEQDPDSRPEVGLTLRFRVLDSASAEAIPVRSAPRDPELEIG